MAHKYIEDKALINSGISADVWIDNKRSKLVYDYSKSHHDMYIEGYLTILHIDSSIDEEDDAKRMFENVLDDISKQKIEILKYSLLGLCRYDFSVTHSTEWSDYPRSSTVTLELLRLFGRRRSCGYLRLAN